MLNEPRNRAAALVIRNGKLLLIARERDGERYWIVPGGGIEAGEEPIEAARRELLEETGLQAATLELVETLHEYGRTFYYFLADEVTGEPQLGTEELAKTTPTNSYRLTWINQVTLARLNLRPLAIRQHCIDLIDTAILRECLMPAGVTFRPWRPSDFATIKALSHAEGWTTATYQQDAYVIAWDFSWPRLVAEADGEVIAFLRALSDGWVSTYLAELLVAPAWRGRGVGSTLVEACRQLAWGTRLDVLAAPTARQFYLNNEFDGFAGFRRQRPYMD